MDGLAWFACSLAALHIVLVWAVARRLVEANGHAPLLIGGAGIMLLQALMAVVAAVVLSTDGAFNHNPRVLVLVFSNRVLDLGIIAIWLWTYARLTRARSVWELARDLVVGRN